MTPPARKRSLRGEDGAVLVWFAILLPVMLALAAFVIDIGHAFMLKRHLQSSADAAALAAAQDLPANVVADATARHYSASTGGLNERSSLPDVTTTIEFPEPHFQKVRVIQDATSPVFFAGILGLDGIDVTAKATASKSSTVGGTPLAVYVHELCGNKGLIAGGLNMSVEGGIHVNGHLEIKDRDFESLGPATVFRPPAPESPTPPTQPAACKTIDYNASPGMSTYCTGCASGPVNAPAPGPYRDWVTPYHAKSDLTSVAPCTHTPSGDVTHDNPLTAAEEGVYCLAPGKKFIVKDNVTGPGGAPARITAIADFIEVGGTGKLTPYNDAAPVLFYSTSSADVILNPSLAYDWNGYIINRHGGIKINADGVTSPQNGLLEAEWIEVNGPNFTMLGTFADSPSGGQFGAPALEE